MKQSKKPSKARGGETLAARIVSVPKLVNAEAAQQRVDEWLVGQTAAVKSLLAANARLGALLAALADHSPYLWELVSSDPDRLLRVLQADPDSHLATLLDVSSRAIAASKDEASAMRLLRRMKSEAALLIALADIGGVWPVMRAALALTDLADHAVDAAVRFLLADAARDGKLK